MLQSHQTPCDFTRAEPREFVNRVKLIYRELLSLQCDIRIVTHCMWLPASHQGLVQWRGLCEASETRCHLSNCIRIPGPRHQRHGTAGPTEDLSLLLSLSLVVSVVSERKPLRLPLASRSKWAMAPAPSMSTGSAVPGPWPLRGWHAHCHACPGWL